MPTVPETYALPCFQEEPFMLVGNRRVGGTRTFPVHNPFTGAEVGRAPIATREQIRTALESSHRASPGLGSEERAALLENVAAFYGTHGEAAAWLITAEAGIAIRRARHEVQRAVNGLRSAAWQARVLGDEDPAAPFRSPLEASRARMEVRSEPLDLAVAITPFNHPLNQVVHKVAPAIAAGASMVLKPSEKAPLSALLFAEALIQCGMPENLLNVVTGQPPASVARQLVTHPLVDLVSFTGSVEVGKHLARTMVSKGGELRRFLPELGGNSALVVLEDADLERAARIALGAFDNAGQRCTAIKRLLIAQRVADDFLDLFLDKVSDLRCGDPFDPATDLGPVIDEQAARRIEGRVAAALHAGARLLCGHRRRGALYLPTVLDQVEPDAELVRRETFGPVAPILRVRGLDEAIRMIRNGPFRLAGAIVTASEERARRFARETRLGQVSWNGPPGYRTESAPFGGFGDSGNGEKEGIVCASRVMLRLRTFYEHDGTR